MMHEIYQGLESGRQLPPANERAPPWAHAAYLARVEEFRPNDVAYIMGVGPTLTNKLLSEAHNNGVADRCVIFVAGASQDNTLDINTIEEMGHLVQEGRSSEQILNKVARDRPDLVVYPFGTIGGGESSLSVALKIATLTSVPQILFAKNTPKEKVPPRTYIVPERLSRAALRQAIGRVMYKEGALGKWLGEQTE